MSKSKKPKQSTLARLQVALKDADGYCETVFLVYANHITKRFQNGVVGDPNVLHGIFDYMLSNYDQGIADQPTRMAVQCMMTAIALHYEPQAFAEKLEQIRKEIQDIENSQKN